jgi:Lon protease-like protein
VANLDSVADPLPLFPLGTVLFPGGRLSLRIFEPRYLDLVRDCTRQGHGFGVCLILAGREVGEPALPAAIGCEANIIDFSATADGLLGIVVVGGRRFRVERTRVRDNGLLLGDIAWLPEVDRARVRPEHHLLSVVLGRLCERAGDACEKAELEDAEWVGWRLGEWLPLTHAQRQGLLQENDPHARLQRLVEQLPQFQAP